MRLMTRVKTILLGLRWVFTIACSRRLNSGDGRERSERQKRARKGGAGESWKRANVPSFRSPLLWLFPLRSPFGATLHYFESMTHAIFTRKEESNDSDNFSESLLLIWRGNKRPEVNWSTIKVNLFSHHILFDCLYAMPTLANPSYLK